MPLHTTTNNWYTSSRGWKSTIPCKPYKPNKPQYTYAKPESHRYTINTIHISLSLFHYTCVHLDRISSFDIIKNDTHNLQTIPFITHLLEELEGKKFYTRNNTFNSLLLFFLRVHWTHPTHLTLRWSSWLPHRSTKTIGKLYSVCWCGHLGVFFGHQTFCVFASLDFTITHQSTMRASQRLRECAYTELCVRFLCIVFFRQNKTTTFDIPHSQKR